MTVNIRNQSSRSIDELGAECGGIHRSDDSRLRGPDHYTKMVSLILKCVSISLDTCWRL